MWGIKYRLLLEQIERLANWLRADQSRELAVVEEHAVRLLLGVARLLRQHQVNNRGQCRFCEPTRRGRRLWHRRSRCTVYQALDFAMGQPLDVVWWQLCASTGRDVALVEVRKWLEKRDQAVREVEGDDTVVVESMSE